MMLSIQQCNFTFHYRPGKEIPVADTRSRMHILNVDSKSESRNRYAVHIFFRDLPISSKMMKQIRVETQNDSELNVLKRVI
jgi:hypothetical protein